MQNECQWKFRGCEWQILIALNPLHGLREFARIERICMSWGNLYELREFAWVEGTDAFAWVVFIQSLKPRTPKFQVSCSKAMFKFRSRIFTEFVRNHDSNRIHVCRRLIELKMNVMYIVWFRTNSESLEILYKFKVYITKTAIHASIFDVDFKYFEFGPSHWRSKIHIESTFWTITTWNKELRPETVFAHEISSWKTNIFNKRTAKAHLNVVHQECEWNNCYSDKRKQQKYHHQHQKACDLTLVKTKPKTKSKKWKMKKTNNEEQNEWKKTIELVKIW